MLVKRWANTLALSVGLLASSSFVRAQNPVPLINLPLVPTAAAPDGASFTLVVDGTGFVPGSVVKWNGTSKTTSFVNSSQLRADIAAADIAAAGTAIVTVFNPAPGGGVSNVVYFQVASAAASVALNTFTLPVATGVFTAVAADFNGDGKLDLAVAGPGSGGSQILVFLGNGDGTFRSPMAYPTGSYTSHLTVGDLNGDGKLDLIAANAGDDTVSVLLGNGDGTFQPRSNYNAGTYPFGVATGDFRGAGKLDVVVANAKRLTSLGVFVGGNTMSVLLGNGDGTLQAPVESFFFNNPQGVFVGDFNGDGKLDIAIANADDNSVSILLGNGDGTFKFSVPGSYPVGTSPQWIAGADLNGDGKLDLVVANMLSNNVSVLLGNGDGTFQTHVDYNTGADPTSVAIGDLNGDGRLDLVTANCLADTCQITPSSSSSISILLGNGDGTFQGRTDFATGSTPLAVLLGDFNGDGRLDIATANSGNGTVSVFLQAPPAPSLALSATSINFSAQLVSTSSAAQSTTLTNSGTAPLMISSIAITGANSSEFAQTNTCPASNATLAVNANCTVSMTFTPTVAGSLGASVAITDNASGSPHTVALTGTGTDFSLGAASGPNCPAGGNCSTSTTITAGGTAVYNLQVSSNSGFNANVALTCSGAPSPSICSVSPNSVPSNGTSNYSFTVTVTNTSGVTALPFFRPYVTIYEPPLPLPVGLLFLTLVSTSMLLARMTSSVGRSKYVLGPALGLVFLILAYTAGCGGNGGTNRSQQVNATLTVAGSSSGVTHTLSLSLTVNP